MKICNYQLNWLSITSGGLAATLLLMSDVQAAESIPATSAVAQSTTPELIALARNKKIQHRKAKPKIKRSSQPAAKLPAAPRDIIYTQAPPAAPIKPQIISAPAPAPASLAPAPAPESLVTPVPVPVAPAPVAEAPKAETPATIQFSINTKLTGQSIFALTGTVAGDFSRNTALGQRLRLDLKTDINGGTLTTRIQSIGLGLANRNPTAGTTAVITTDGRIAATDSEGSLSGFGMDAIKYEFAPTSQTQAVVAVNVGVADDFADTVNPFFDIGDGGGGAITSFASRPSIYYGLEGVGGGIRHKLSDSMEVSLGYLTRQGNDPAVGSGLFGGGYGALAQVTFKPSENAKIALTYTRTKNSDFTTGSTNANQGGDSNNFGVQGSFLLDPQLAVGGWAGYTQNQLAGVDRQIWNWAVTAAAPNFGGEGNIAGLLVGQSPRVTSASDGTADTKAGLHIEGFYQVKLSENLSITPGIIYLTAPNHDANSQPAVIGALRTTFLF